MRFSFKIEYIFRFGMKTNCISVSFGNPNPGSINGTHRLLYGNFIFHNDVKNFFFLVVSFTKRGQTKTKSFELNDWSISDSIFVAPRIPFPVYALIHTVTYIFFNNIYRLAIYRMHHRRLYHELEWFMSIQRIWDLHHTGNVGSTKDQLLSKNC